MTQNEYEGLLMMRPESRVAINESLAETLEAMMIDCDTFEDECESNICDFVSGVYFKSVKHRKNKYNKYPDRLYYRRKMYQECVRDMPDEKLKFFREFITLNNNSIKIDDGGYRKTLHKFHRADIWDWVSTKQYLAERAEIDEANNDLKEYGNFYVKPSYKKLHKDMRRSKGIS